MNIENLYPGSWGSNCYLLTENGRAALVDPSADATVLLEAVTASGCVLDFILLTHGHFDHILSVDTLRERTGADLLIHTDDAPMLTDSRKNAFYTFFHMERTYSPTDKLLHDGDEILLGGSPIRVIHTPGHSPGSVCFLCNGEFLLTGDTLFAEGYGRYDLWGGSASQLSASLNSLHDLSQNLTVYPGHGAPENLGIALSLAVL